MEQIADGLGRRLACCRILAQGVSAMRCPLFFIYIVFAACAAVAQSPKLINMSTRVTLTGGQAIVGFVVQGDQSARLLVRAVGPSLAAYGVAGNADPELEIATVPAVRVDDWAATLEMQQAVSAVGAFPLPFGSRDAAAIVTAAPGPLTVIVRGAAGGGEVLVEVYQIPDTRPAAPTGLVVTSALGAGIALDWDDSTATDFYEYGIYRSITNSPGTAVKIAETGSSQFFDTGRPSGVRFFYWVTAITRGELESPKSNPTSGVAFAGI